MPSEQVLRSADEKVEKNRANPPLFGTFWRGFTAIPLRTNEITFSEH